MGEDRNHPLDRPREDIYHCPRCLRSYPYREWTVLEFWDEHHPIGSFYRCSEIRCPRGHDRHVDFSYEVDVNPPTHRSSPRWVAPEQRFWAWVIRTFLPIHGRPK